MQDAIFEFTIALFIMIITVGAQAQTTGPSIEKGRKIVAQADNNMTLTQQSQKTPESWSKNEIERAGHELQAAANDAELALGSAGRRLEGATVGIIRDARADAAKLIADASWTTDEVGKELDTVGKEIEKLGNQIYDTNW